MKFLDFFSGIGGFRLGMEMAGHECVGHCEIDKFANKSYEAMHQPKESEFYATDIRTVEPGDLPDADCYCFGFPCQAFSVAGKRGGFEDTRGTLFFEIMRLAAVRKPKYLFAENVAGLLSNDRGKTFGTILNTLGQLGYWFEYQVLNSKDFGVPQNRSRVFIIGHLGRYSGGEIFPVTGGSSQTLKQIIGGSQAETGLYLVDLSTNDPRITDNARCIQARYYKGFSARTGENSGVLDTRVYQKTHGSTTTCKINETGTLQSARIDKVPCVEVREATKKGFDIAYEGDSINFAVPESRTRRGRVGKGLANTLDTGCNQATLYKGRIRRLTPKECFRLQGFPDEYFERAAKVNSDSQLYKQAGNSVTVNVIYEIAKRL